MNAKRLFVFMFILQSMVIGLPDSLAQVPGVINYQGRVAVNGTNFDGVGQFKFALLDGGSGAALWSNGTSEVSLTVTKGLYSVLLGDTGIANMGTNIDASVFANSNVQLRVWFGVDVPSIQQLAPDQRLAAAPYALQAAAVCVVNTSGITNFIARAIPAATGADLTVAGDGAGEALTTSIQCTLIGRNAGKMIRSSYTTAVGAHALMSATNGICNTAVGQQAMMNLMKGERNTAVGAGAMKGLTNGTYNVAVGVNAMEVSTNGEHNVAIGGRTLRSCTGNYNTGVGREAGFALTVGGYNTLLGASAGSALTEGSGNILIGYSSAASSVAASNEFVAGSGTWPVTNVYFGKGAVSATPVAYTIRGTSGSGASVAGGSVTIAGGTSGGSTPAGGAVVIQTSTNNAGQTLTSQLIVTNGWVVMPALPTATNNFILSGTLWNSNGVLSVWMNP